MKRHLTVFAAISVLSTAPLLAKDAVKINVPAEGSVTLEQALDSWSRIYKVVSHPRCSNCHVGADNKPMWSGPSYGKARPHGMNVNAGESRIGVETILCSTCHTTKSEDWEKANLVPHSAPRVAMDWRLAPVEAEWFGKSSTEICNQLRDPKLNGDRSFMDIAEHLNHDLILHWAWSPGGGREPAPYSLQEHVDDILIWGVGGQPCENDG